MIIIKCNTYQRGGGDKSVMPVYVYPKEFTWLAQLLYGQQLALELSKQLGTNPDIVRADQSRYNEVKNLVTL